MRLFFELHLDLFFPFLKPERDRHLNPLSDSPLAALANSFFGVLLLLEIFELPAILWGRGADSFPFDFPQMPPFWPVMDLEKKRCKEEGRERKKGRTQREKNLFPEGSLLISLNERKKTSENGPCWFFTTRHLFASQKNNHEEGRNFFGSPSQTSFCPSRPSTVTAPPTTTTTTTHFWFHSLLT